VAAHAAKEKMLGTSSSSSSSRGILAGGNRGNSNIGHKRTQPHPRDIQTVNVLELNANANPKEYSVRELCEGSFLTTDGLKELVQAREMEIERTKKQNVKQNKQNKQSAQRAQAASLGSRPESPMLIG